MSKHLCVVALVSGVVGLLIASGFKADAQTAVNVPKAKQFRIERSMAPQAAACLVGVQ